MATAIRGSLLDLPQELLALIVDYINDGDTLQCLTRTCRRTQSLAEPKLYRTLLIRTGPHMRSIQRALEANSDRAKSLEFLDVPCDNTRPPHFQFLADVLRSADNLREFMFESPSCNSTGDFEDASAWNAMTQPLFSVFDEASLKMWSSGVTEPPLQKLQKVTLHLNGAGSPYWDLEASTVHILLHPTLEELHMSCVNIDDFPTSAISSTHLTPLRHLTLEECNITHTGLSKLLSLPTALQSLFLGENCHNVLHFRGVTLPPYSNHLFERNSQTTIDALKQQKHSLQSLTYTTTPMYPGLAELASFNSSTSNPVDGGLSDFEALEHVKLVGLCPLFERALMALSPPPNLHHLAFKAKKMFRKSQNAHPEDTSPISSIPFLRAPSMVMPQTLKNLTLTYTADHGIMVIDLVTPGSRERSFLREAAVASSELGIELRVLATGIQGDKIYFPPYLYGETHPPEDVIYEKGEFVESFAMRGERRPSRMARALLLLRSNAEESE